MKILNMRGGFNCRHERMGTGKHNDFFVHGIAISPEWDFPLSFEQLIEKCKFIFSHSSYGGERIKIVINEKLEGRYDCFEIGNDRWGAIIKADTYFNEGWGAMIVDSSCEPIQFIKDYFIRQGATDLLTNRF